MIKDSTITVRISPELHKRINAFCQMKKINNQSEFFRQAAVRLITPDVSDELLVFESLKDLHNKMRALESQQDLFFSFFCQYMKLFLVYNPELPINEKEAAARMSFQRFEKIFQSFKESLTETPSMFESLLADQFEEMNG